MWVSWHLFRVGSSRLSRSVLQLPWA
jgi:hypothetical protein